MQTLNRFDNSLRTTTKTTNDLKDEPMANVIIEEP